jgi:Saccharopine dehydrogenase NADP binding domain
MSVPIGSVLVLGAGGALGRRCARLLAAGLPGARVIPASRRGAAALGTGARTLDVRDAGSLAAGLGGVDLVVNAVGPYRYDPAPLVRACVAARVHALDLAEDVAYRSALAAEAERAGAAAAGVAFVSGCSTAPGLVELLAQGFAGVDRLAAVDAWLSLGTRNPVSAGLLVGLLRPLGRPAPDAGRWFESRVRHEVDGRRLAFGRYPSGLPGERLRLEGRELPLRFHAGFDRAWLVRALCAAAPRLAALSDDALARLARVALPAAQLARPCGGARGALLLEARDADGRVAAEVEVVALREGLDVPAAPVLWAARALARGPRAGVLRLADLVTRSEALAGLAALGCAVREHLHSDG